jgi:hypothetical protein
MSAQHDPESEHCRAGKRAADPQSPRNAARAATNTIMSGKTIKPGRTILPTYGRASSLLLAPLKAAVSTGLARASARVALASRTTRDVPGSASWQPQGAARPFDGLAQSICYEPQGMSIQALIVDPEAPNTMRIAEVAEPTAGRPTR